MFKFIREVRMPEIHKNDINFPPVCGETTWVDYVDRLVINFIMHFFYFSILAGNVRRCVGTGRDRQEPLGRCSFAVKLICATTC